VLALLAGLFILHRRRRAAFSDASRLFAFKGDVSTARGKRNSAINLTIRSLRQRKKGFRHTLASIRFRGAFCSSEVFERWSKPSVTAIIGEGQASEKSSEPHCGEYYAAREKEMLEQQRPILNSRQQM
jgi:hypothetical protein